MKRFLNHGRRSLSFSAALVAVPILMVLVAGCVLDDEAGDDESSGGWTVSGRVTDREGAGLDRVSVSLVGMPEGRYNGDPLSRLTSTNGFGTFSFSNIPEGSYTVTPHRTGFAFHPRTTAAVVTGDNVNLDPFSGYPSGGDGADGNSDSGNDGDDGAGGHAISGTVIDTWGEGVSGVRVGLFGEEASQSVTTDGSGRFRFVNVPVGAYTIAPGAGGYTFVPPSADVFMRTYSITLDSFTAVANEPQPPGGSDPGGSSDYYPLRRNASWSLSVEEIDYRALESVSATVTRAITGTREYAGRVYWTVTDDEGDVVSLVRIGDGALYSFSDLANISALTGPGGKDGSGGDTGAWDPYSDEMPLIRLDASPGETHRIASWERSISGAVLFKEWQGRFEGYEDVTVIAGTFENCRRHVVELVSYAVGGGASRSETTRTTIWLAPEVGPVKRRVITSDGIETFYERDEELVGWSIP